MPSTLRLVRTHRHRRAARPLRAPEQAYARAVRLLREAELLLRAVHAPAAVGALDAPTDELTEREREVAGLIARGCTSREIAERLVISVKTADTHATHIREKLGLRSRAEIAAWAVARGVRSAA